MYRLLSAGTVEERIVERAEKKLYLDQMVNRGSSNRDVEDAGLSTSELLATLTFGSNAVFSSSNDLPTDLDIEKLTDRARSEDCSDGKLRGGAAQTAADYDMDRELTDTRRFCGVDFRKLREEKEAREKELFLGKGPKSKLLNRLKQDWKMVQTGESLDDMGKGKRDRKCRLIQVKSNGSGWGTSHVPVLAMNDYDLQSGEPSSWGRETKKIVSIEKKRVVNDFIHQDFCQICGDGGLLIECPRCPVSVHIHCCGIKPGNFQCCTHHHCAMCSKTALGAGGLLYRCQSCPNAWCPDCIPEKPHRYLGTNVQRFEELSFNGNPLYYYIHCSSQCEEVARLEFGFKDISKSKKCPPSLDVTYAFGKDALDIKSLTKKFKEASEGKSSSWSIRKPISTDGVSSPRKQTPLVKASVAATGGVVDLWSLSPQKRNPTVQARAATAGGVIDLCDSPLPSKQTGGTFKPYQ